MLVRRHAAFPAGTGKLTVSDRGSDLLRGSEQMHKRNAITGGGPGRPRARAQMSPRCNPRINLIVCSAPLREMMMFRDNEGRVETEGGLVRLFLWSGAPDWRIMEAARCVVDAC